MKTRRDSLRVGILTTALGVILAVGNPATAIGGTGGQSPGGPLERTRLTVGLAVQSLALLPTYLAAEQTGQAEGLDVQLVSFGGGSKLAMALASGSVDLGVMSVSVMIGMVAAGQAVQAFYLTSSHADYAWIARPEIRGWGDMRGRSITITAFGSLTDALTRHVLRRHGLEPGSDVTLVQSGELANGLAALRAGRADAAALTPPFTWYAEERGFRPLGSQVTEIGPAWPRHVLVATERFLAEHPNTLRAYLRAYVRAIRMARGNREAAVQLLMTRLKYERRYAKRAYTEAMTGFDEHGRLPAEAMHTFWEMAVASGEVKQPWPESRFFDRRFVDTFDEWAPK